MPRYGYCYDERDHQEQARDDARYGHRDYSRYDPYTSDPCKEVYTEAYDRETRRIEERREEERQEEVRREREAIYRREEAAQWESQQYPYPEPEYPEPTEEEVCGSNGHPYYGDDEVGPRCYCEKRREFPEKE